MHKVNWSNLNKKFYHWLSDGKFRKPQEYFDWFRKNLFPKQRTNKQNNALHLYFDMISKQFNNLGWQYNYVNPFTGEIVEIPWDLELIKKYVWKPLQFELFGFDKTSSLSTDGINQIIKILDQHFAQKGIDIEFPNWQSYMNKLEKEHFDKLNGIIE